MGHGHHRRKIAQEAAEIDEAERLTPSAAARFRSATNVLRRQSVGKVKFVPASKQSMKARANSPFCTRCCELIAQAAWPPIAMLIDHADKKFES